MVHKPNGFLFLLLSLINAVPCMSQARTETEQNHELIVLLAPGEDAPTPEQIVTRAKRGSGLGGGLDVGAPLTARPMIAKRSNSVDRAKNERSPETPKALLQRYIVIRYPADTDLDEVVFGLGQNRNVLWVGRNETVEISLQPNDPLFRENQHGFPVPPDEHQWGSHALELLRAWDLTTGSGYVALIDLGIDTDHEDFLDFDAGGTYLGGNFRAHMSFDFGYGDTNVDEGQPQNGQAVTLTGHGSHVAGIVGGTPNNQTGIAGACWDCSLIVSKITRLDSGVNTSVAIDDWVEGITGSVAQGAQVLSMSLGMRPNGTPPFQARDCTVDPLDPLCVAIELARDRDAIVVAAAGNDGTNDIDWPASDDRVLAAGGLEPVLSGGVVSSVAFWDDCPGFECGSNADPDQFNMPAQSVVSTFYEGIPYAPTIGCDDSLLPGFPGYGPCSGTSMSAPYLAGSTALIRSVNPLLTQQDASDILMGSLNNPVGWNPNNGYGIPDMGNAVETAFGVSDGARVTNRLTPLFTLYSTTAETHFSTSVPQMAAAAIEDSGLSYLTEVGGMVAIPPRIPGYDFFPGANCIIGPCLQYARASVYVFTSDNPPFAGAPALVPLYRMSYEGAWNGNPENRSYFYTTETGGLELLHQVGYRLDGIEGYIYGRCDPDCQPAGTVKLYRMYHAGRDDYAIFPETELAAYQAAGYTGLASLNDYIGYVYPNTDTDGDHVIDGFETIAGTDPAEPDSDCDGTDDGVELLEYPYADPLDGTCTPGVVMGEVGQKPYFSSNARTVYLSRRYEDPVVFAQPVSFNNSEPAIVRITDIQSDRFTLEVQEAPDRDGSHPWETISYMVLERGVWRLPDGAQIRVGYFDINHQVGRGVPNAWAPIPNIEGLPTIGMLFFSQVQSNNQPNQWIKTRQNAIGKGMSLALEREEAATGALAAERVAWLGIDTGTHTWNGLQVEAGSTGRSVTHGFTTRSFQTPFQTTPLLLGNVASYYGPDSCQLRYNALTPTSVAFKVEEDTTRDPEVNHTSEIIHYLAIGGSGILTATPVTNNASPSLP